MIVRNPIARALFGSRLDWRDVAVPIIVLSFCAWFGAVLAAPRFDAALWWLP